MKRTNKNLVGNIALCGVFAGLIFALALIPNVGFITVIPGLAFTILHAVTIMFILIAPRKNMAVYGLVFGTIFGLSSLTAAVIFPGPFSEPFLNPLISVVPRALFGFACGLAGQLIITDRVVAVRTRHMITCAVIAGLSTLLHTTLVLGALNIFVWEMSLGEVVKLALTVNMPVEIGVAALLALAAPRVQKAIELK